MTWTCDTATVFCAREHDHNQIARTELTSRIDTVFCGKRAERPDRFVHRRHNPENLRNFRCNGEVRKSRRCVCGANPPRTYRNNLAQKNHDSPKASEPVCDRKLLRLRRPYLLVNVVNCAQCACQSAPKINRKEKKKGAEAQQEVRVFFCPQAHAGHSLTAMILSGLRIFVLTKSATFKINVHVFSSFNVSVFSSLSCISCFFLLLLLLWPACYEEEVPSASASSVHLLLWSILRVVRRQIGRGFYFCRIQVVLTCEFSALDAFYEKDGRKSRYIGEVLEWYRGEDAGDLKRIELAEKWTCLIFLEKEFLNSNPKILTEKKS